MPRRHRGVRSYRALSIGLGPGRTTDGALPSVGVGWPASRTGAAEIEPLRKDKRIGSSLQPKCADGVEPSSLLASYADQLPMRFIVSEVDGAREHGYRVNFRFASSGRTASNEIAAGLRAGDSSRRAQSAGLCSRSRAHLGYER